MVLSVTLELNLNSRRIPKVLLILTWNTVINFQVDSESYWGKQRVINPVGIFPKYNVGLTNLTLAKKISPNWFSSAEGKFSLITLPFDYAWFVLMNIWLEINTVHVVQNVVKSLWATANTFLKISFLKGDFVSSYDGNENLVPFDGNLYNDMLTEQVLPTNFAPCLQP